MLPRCQTPLQALNSGEASQLQQPQSALWLAWVGSSPAGSRLSVPVQVPHPSPETFGWLSILVMSASRASTIFQRWKHSFCSHPTHTYGCSCVSHPFLSAVLCCRYQKPALGSEQNLLAMLVGRLVNSCHGHLLACVAAGHARVPWGVSGSGGPLPVVIHSKFTQFSQSQIVPCSGI